MRGRRGAYFSRSASSMQESPPSRLDARRRTLEKDMSSRRESDIDEVLNGGSHGAYVARHNFGSGRAFWADRRPEMDAIFDRQGEDDGRREWSRPGLRRSRANSAGLAAGVLPPRPR